MAIICVIIGFGLAFLLNPNYNYGDDRSEQSGAAEVIGTGRIAAVVGWCWVVGMCGVGVS